MRRKVRGATALCLVLAVFSCETADVSGASECRAGYAKARSPADTVVVDARPTSAKASITCGTLRRAGKL
jgi:hypothetical protein